MIDWDVITTPGFVLLCIGSWAATLIGWVWSKKSEMASFSVPTLLIVLVIELIAAYYFAAKG